MSRASFWAARRRDERGAYAVMFALLATALFGLAALGVDLGNLYQRKAETQSQADLAATSAAAKLTVSQAAAVQSAADYLNHNLKAGQDAISASQLTDGDLGNGEVTFPSKYAMKVVTPGATVNFGLSVPLTGNSSTDVASSATVGLGTPAADHLIPFYAVFGEGCDYGAQTLSDPANGHVQSIVPTNLQSPASNSSQTTNSVLDHATPYQFDVGVTGTVTIEGSGLSGVTTVGFYRKTSESPNIYEVPATSASSSQVTATLPAGVAGAAGVWWIRVYKNTGNKGWTALDNALPIRIGDGPIMCPGTSDAGNYGMLKLARSTQPSTWAPDNIASGLDPPLSLTVQTNTAQIPECTPGAANVVYTATTGGATRYPNTNCVDTDTGLTAQVATQGLVTGTGTGKVGRLELHPTTTAVAGRECSPGHVTRQRQLLGHSVNDDTLSCFMANPAMTLADIASPTYSGGPALDPEIYNSPRFCYVPVISVDPTSGGSGHYSITDIRPCFITSEANESSYNTQLFTDGTPSTTMNGTDIQSNRVVSMHVVFFNKNALPADGAAEAGVILDPNGPLVPVLSD
ncbi:pilus assembly protein TadG-related protein [Nocardioides sp.]|uniref:pilus assembly protein TadG-related protein n=1 Tax=Nocardioides sp. TaxID=35761 RepID=UPI003527ED9F